jgi:hypothetical protein
MFIGARKCVRIAAINLEQVIYNFAGALMGFQIRGKFHRVMEVNNERVRT